MPGAEHFYFLQDTRGLVVSYSTSWLYQSAADRFSHGRCDTGLLLTGRDMLLHTEGAAKQLPVEVLPPIHALSWSAP